MKVGRRRRRRCASGLRPSKAAATREAAARRGAAGAAWRGARGGDEGDGGEEEAARERRVAVWRCGDVAKAAPATCDGGPEAVATQAAARHRRGGWRRGGRRRGGRRRRCARKHGGGNSGEKAQGRRRRRSTRGWRRGGGRLRALGAASRRRDAAILVTHCGRTPSCRGLWPWRYKPRLHSTGAAPPRGPELQPASALPAAARATQVLRHRHVVPGNGVREEDKRRRGVATRRASRARASCCLTWDPGCGRRARRECARRKNGVAPASWAGRRAGLAYQRQAARHACNVWMVCPGL